MIQVGNFVKFKKGLYPDEDGAIYKVLEINEDRVVLEFVNTNMLIRPQSIANLSELDLLTHGPLAIKAGK